MNYLLNPSVTRLAPRPGAVIAVLAIHFVLLFFVAITYFRILSTILQNPGYVECGPQFYEGDNEKGNRGLAKLNGRPYTGGIIAGRPNPETESPGLQEFYRKNVFICEGDGRPIWCSICMNWKVDRSHHCREVGRCVRKMDHYCPWLVYLTTYEENIHE